MIVWQRLKHLLPSRRRAQELEMREELQSLADFAEPGELGNITRVAEDARAMWSWEWLEQVSRDVQYACRTLRHNPGFTAAAVLSLALGIGANTAIFSLVDALMLRWLPVADPQQLVQLKVRSTRGSATPSDASFSNAIVTALAEQKEIFANAAGFSASSFDVGPRGSISRVPGALVTGGYYQTLGVSPALGRHLEPADDQPGAPAVAVISYAYWERQFAASPDVAGRSITVDNVPVTIVGVSARGFQGATVGVHADITMATASLPAVSPAMAGLLNPGNFWLRVLARPPDGVSTAQAQTRLAARWPQIAAQAVNPRWPEWQRKELAASIVELAPGGTGYTYLRERFQQPLMILMAVTALVLLIACANVASLLLARATAREREISVRLAIGAGRGRIIRQLLTESTLLSLLGAALGVGLAWLTSRILVDTLAGEGPGALPPVFDLTPNWHVLAFASAVAIANGILFGLAPALQTTAIGGSRVVQGDTRITRSRSRLLSSLVTAQVALALLLLMSAGLFARTMQNLLNVDAGFRSEGALVVELDGQREGYRGSALMEFYRGLLHDVRQVPGVVSASLTSHTPLSGSSWSEAAAPKGQPLPQRDNAVFIAASPGFFADMQTALISGRDFDEHDQGAPNVAIVNQAYARLHFPNRNPVGQYLSATVTRPASDLQIVGVVKDVMTRSLRVAPRPTVYVSYFQRAPRMDSLVIRVSGPLAQTAAAIRKQLQPRFPTSLLEVGALSDQVERTLVEERLMMRLTGGFGVLGLALACVGLYGLLGYSVVRQTKEIGIRMALGAQRRGVQWMIVRRALRLMTIGVALGVPAAWVVLRWLQSMLFGLTATDPAVIAGSVTLMALAGLLAAWFPAKRATRVDPMTALRTE